MFGFYTQSRTIRIKPVLNLDTAEKTSLRMGLREARMTDFFFSFFDQ